MAFSDRKTLLGQPIEVRHKIYSLLLESDSNIQPKEKNFEKTTEYHNLQNMGLVCRAMNEDAKVIFFGQDTFEFAASVVMTNWLHKIGRSIQYVKKIFIKLAIRGYTGWRPILIRLGRNATNLQVLQLRVCWMIYHHAGQYARVNGTVHLGPLTTFSDSFGIDDLIQLISKINSLRTIKLVGEIDKSLMDDICQSTSCEVQALRCPRDFACWDNLHFEVWRAVRPAVHVVLEKEYRDRGQLPAWILANLPPTP